VSASANGASERRIQTNIDVELPLGRTCIAAVGDQKVCAEVKPGTAARVAIGALQFVPPAGTTFLAQQALGQVVAAKPGSQELRATVVGAPRSVVVEPKKLTKVQLSEGAAGTLVLDVEAATLPDACRTSLMVLVAQEEFRVFDSAKRAERGAARIALDVDFGRLTLLSDTETNKEFLPPSKSLRLTRIDVETPDGVRDAEFHLTQGRNVLCTAKTQTGLWVFPGTYQLETSWRDADQQLHSVSRTIVAP
jgi:hypothetical protein